MKKFNLYTILILSLATVLFTSCEKSDDNGTDVAPQFTLELDHLCGADKFYLDSTYTNIILQPFTPSMLRYYISNVSLIGSDSSEYKLPENYSLVDLADPESATINFTGLKSGTYQAIKFTIGVDSARNVSGAQTGALDPANGMFWDWNTGYVFFKLEGTSPAITGPSQFFEYHVGGFESPNNNLRTVIFDFDGDILNLAVNRHPEVHVMVDVMQALSDPNVINFTTFPTTVVMPGPEATQIADNYFNMFTFDHLHDN